MTPLQWHEVRGSMANRFSISSNRNGQNFFGRLCSFKDREVSEREDWREAEDIIDVIESSRMRGLGSIERID